MIKKYFALFLFSIMFSPGVNANPGNGLETCSALPPPFDTLVQMTLDTTVDNPPQVQLCHRIANSEKHNQMERTDKAINELSKYILEVQQSTPLHIGEAYASTLIAEAEQVISILSGNVIVEGTVSGGVFSFATNEPVVSALVTLSFLNSDQSYTMQTDEYGLFQFKNLPLGGTFVLNATDGLNAVGSANGSIFEGENSASVTILIETPGIGVLQGHISNPPLEATTGILVTAIFPESKREYTTEVDSNGYYHFENIHTDGTVIVIGFDNDSGASASYSSVLTQNYPSSTVDLVLVTPAVINPEFTNSGFSDGLTGWTSSGPVQIIDRNLIFSPQN